MRKTLVSLACMAALLFSSILSTRYSFGTEADSVPWPLPADSRIAWEKAGGQSGWIAQGGLWYASVEGGPEISQDFALVDYNPM